MSEIMLYTAIGASGLYIVVLYLMRAQPALTDAMDHLSGPAPERTHSAGGSFLHNAANSVGDRLYPHLRDSRFFTLPSADLSLLRKDPAHVMGEKLVAALIGLALWPVLNVVMTAAGAGFGWTAPGILALITAAVLFAVPDIEIRNRAAAARKEFAQAFSTYVDLVALCRRASIGTVQSLETAARVGDSWVFLRLDEELYAAGRSGEPPWSALNRVSHELGLAELGDLADVMNISDKDGASIYTSLRARAAALRSAQVSTEQGEAAEATEKLALPLVSLAGIFILLIGIPAVSTITG